MSSSEQSSASSQQQQQQQRVRKPPFADWPTIKILTPPQGKFILGWRLLLVNMWQRTGRFSPKCDEWCFTYCTQSVSGRIHGRDPNCRSLCVRKVFPHEVRNILSFKRHDVVGPDGKAKYPLPAEGQSANLPRILGGTSKDESEDRPTAQTKYWDEGWYLWTGKGRWASQWKTDQMLVDLSKQQMLDKIREDRREIWQDYQEQLRQSVDHQGDISLPSQPPWWVSLVPPKASEDVRCVPTLTHKVRLPTSSS